MTTTQFALLSIADMLEQFPGTTRGQLAQWRYKGTGPRYRKIGRQIFYTEEDVRAFIDGAARVSTRAGDTGI